MVSGCARDATPEDCLNYYVATGKPADVSLDVCLELFSRPDLDQSELNRLFLP